MPETSKGWSVNHVEEVGACQRLKPGEEQFKRKKGYQRFHVVEDSAAPKGTREVRGEAPDGSYQWRYDFTSNEAGKPTKEWHEVQELLRPSLLADQERVAKHHNQPGAYGTSNRRRTHDKLASVCSICGYNKYLGQCNCKEAA